MSGTGASFGVPVALSSVSRLPSTGAASHPDSQTTLCPSSGVGEVSPGPVGEGLSERDWALVRDVARLRLATGAQLERLHFAQLGEPSRSVVRRRVLRRLVGLRV